ncbi:flagellar hook protein FlgE [Glaciimonas sp. PAMC28666]|uniref:flagellar hook protein FlgE n=1 Tax=Glaciimonas sp. PAMC28666 TaxID=2807626 RepID=UPI001964F809|nr:flagellar hook protein FlgE [Glaciimonas sp. PAMC28666]QRX83141.1 flagellar hook protein FlgE [Glaciimonas sp. PAMC28666]
MGFEQGVSGLNASSSNLDVIGNNIANSGTTGFKTGTAQFADVYAGSQSGLGVQVATVSQNLSQGVVTTNGVGTDVAISGNGFFQLMGPTGQMSYSRDGAFTQNSSGYLVDSAGLQVTGYQVGANGAIAGGTPSALKLPISTPMPPNPTTQISAEFNLNSGDTTPATTPFNTTDATSYNYSNTITAYDSLGNSHEITSFFVNSGSSTWNVYQTIDGKSLTSSSASTTGTNIGSLTFNSSGTLVTPANGTLTSGSIALSNGAAPMNYTLNLTGTTHYGSADGMVSAAKQNGYTSGMLTSFAINKDGTVTGQFSNNQTNTLGQIVLASFANPNGLANSTGNILTATAASGNPLISAPGGSAGSLTSGALETSNVDLTSELVNLIIAQRTYQANAQTIKTQDEIMQTLVSGL